MIALAHREIHEGNRWTYTFNDPDLDTGAGNKRIRIQTPDSAKRYHLTVAARVSDTATIVIKTGATVNAAGTQRTWRNRKFEVPIGTQPDATLFEDDTFNDEGETRWDETIYGTGNPSQRIGGEVDARGEFILAPNSSEIITITPAASNKTATIIIDVYEATPDNL